MVITLSELTLSCQLLLNYNNSVVVLVIVAAGAVVCSFMGVQTRQLPVFLFSISKQFLQLMYLNL